MTTTTYCHVLNGRIRLKLSNIKRAPTRARQIEQALQQLRGVRQVQANPQTGNVLVLFNAEQINAEKVLAVLNQFAACAPLPAKMTTPRQAPAYSPLAAQVAITVAEAFVKKAAEVAAQKLIVALL